MYREPMVFRPKERALIAVHNVKGLAARLSITLPGVGGGGDEQLSVVVVGSVAQERLRRLEQMVLLHHVLTKIVEG